ncbi:MAG: hypothetical protein HY812_08115 [Planctomycetes bacterium]|nr:hypothetical protein [Planctomycetota bacterium]
MRAAYALVLALLSPVLVLPVGAHLSMCVRPLLPAAALESCDASTRVRCCCAPQEPPPAAPALPVRQASDCDCCVTVPLANQAGSVPDSAPGQHPALADGGPPPGSAWVSRPKRAAVPCERERAPPGEDRLLPLLI